MVYIQKNKWSIAKKINVGGNIYTCEYCSAEFTPKHHGTSKPKYCSHICSNKGTLELRKKKWEEKRRLNKLTKLCEFCKKEYEKPFNYSLPQWNTNKFCSIKCSGNSRKINDGLTVYQRKAKKVGSPKVGSEEWVEKIRARTKEAMYRPEIQAKIRQSKSPLTLEHKLKVSNAHAGKLPKNMMFGGSGNFPNVQRGDYECSKGLMYFRSKWEANYALFLDFLIEKGEIKDWQFEPDVFMFEEIKLGTRSYRPDFKVFNKDGSFEYHEVKGYMDSKSKTKLKRMAKYYPEFKLVLVDSVYYRDLIKKLKGIIKFYD